MSSALGTALLIGVAGVVWFVAARAICTRRQLTYIGKYAFHSGIRKKLLLKYPDLDKKQLSPVFQALRDYFYICHRANARLVAMPSQVVDDAWHEFILSTRLYSEFCKKAFGRFLHHTLAEAMQQPTMAQEGIKRAWRIACAKENINSRRPERLPLIFAIDGSLKIPNGFTYHLNCNLDGAQIRSDYCATHIRCAAGCSGGFGGESGGASSFFDGGGDSGGGSCGGGGE